jgi:signal transduction histidine kinase
VRVETRFRQQPRDERIPHLGDGIESGFASSGEARDVTCWHGCAARPVQGKMRAMRLSRVVTLLAAGFVLAGLAITLTLEVLAGSEGDPAWVAVAWVSAMLSSTAVGVVLSLRCPRNPIGWLLLASGLVLTVAAVADTFIFYAVLAEPGALPGGEWAVLWSERAWPLLFAPAAAIAWTFPDGHLPSPRWRPAAIAGCASFAVFTVMSFVCSMPYRDELAHVTSPLPQLSGPVFELAFAICGLGALATLVTGTVALRARFIRATPVERLQLKWLAYATALVPVTVVICVVEGVFIGKTGTATVIAIVTTMTALPAAIGVAITRYRLYEIDRLINRTLLYVTLTAGLAVAFAAVTLGLGLAIGSGSMLPTAAATLVVVLLFGPLRSRTQRLVDRRFDRARYEGLQTIHRFLEDLRAGDASPEATGAVLGRALGDPALELIFSLPGSDLQIDASGSPVADGPAREGRSVTPVRRGDLPLATLVHAVSLDERPDLLHSVIEAAGLAIEIARLRVEVRHQLAEVEASRTRIVMAGYEERRRLERDLHDGAQQRLVSLGLALRHIQSELPEASPQARSLDAVVAALAEAIDELRELARGVRPAGLDDGLAPALRELAARSPLRATVEATDERFPAPVETAAYFVASEALANAAKHARASSVMVRAARRNGSLVLSVRDDGVGGASPGVGSGLAGISDRVAALGGTVTVSSPTGTGTFVTAELPCAS